MPTPSRVAVLGAGVVGRNLARRFVELGHDVTFGARDTTSPKVVSALAELPGARVAGLATAVGDAELAVLAVPFGAVTDVIESIGDPGDTVVVDATNPLGDRLPDGVPDVPSLIRHRYPDAVVVKAFNTIGAEAFLDPVVDGHRYFLPIAGPSPAADTVRDLAEAMGFDALVIGDADTAELLESHARLWIHLAFRTGLGRNFGFARLGRVDDR